MGRPKGSKNKTLADATVPQGEPMTEETVDIRPDTPTTPTAPEASVTLTLAQLKELLGGGGGFTPEAIAQAFSATQRKENIAAPMVSQFNPRGERDHPRPAFKPKRIYQNGIELEPDTLMIEEIEALNALRPGSYRVQKANGTRIVLTVQDTIGLDGETLDKREIGFPCKDEQRHDHRGLLEYCLEVLTLCGQTAEAERIQGLRKELDGLRKTG